MTPSKISLIALALAAGLGTSACTDGYGYSGVSMGYGSGWDPYYGGFSADPYWGWYGDYYYPGTGYYVYDRDHRRHRWNDAQRGYWQGRSRTWHDSHRDIRPVWRDFGERGGHRDGGGHDGGRDHRRH